MVASTQLFGLMAALCALAASASPIAGSQTFAEKDWPVNDVVERELRTESNAQRMARGLAPLSPARLYDPERVHSAPKARLSNSPPPSSDGTYGFTYIACYDDHTAGTLKSITAASDSSAVSQCAAYTSGLSGYEFTLSYTGSGTYACEANAGGSGGSVPCTSTNWAQYSLT